jgi:hypothetical protein
MGQGSREYTFANSCDPLSAPPVPGMVAMFVSPLAERHAGDRKRRAELQNPASTLKFFRPHRLAGITSKTPAGVDFFRAHRFGRIPAWTGLLCVQA